MKINWTSLFGNKKSPKDKDSSETDEIEYDKHADFYYTNLINSLILFSLTAKELQKMAGPVFNPLSELETEIDYAYTPVLFDTIFRKGLIDKSYRSELLSFKKLTDDIPSEIWNFESMEKEQTWALIRQKANALLDILGVKSRTYNEDYTTVYGKDGTILKKGKNCS
jgi:hypothetical protein